MNNLLSEFQELIAQYHDASDALAKAMSNVDSSDVDAISKVILRQSDCLGKVDQMNDRVSRLCNSWKTLESQCDQETRKKTLAAKASAKVEAAKLNELCAKCIKLLETARNKQGEELENIGKRKQYLQAMKPVKGNYPKFIDTTY
jgi:hypothetical protein